ncbi:MoaD/ThiS family protein [Oceanirhabdus sp. W0125-5]|uniref:MoaD/ThiS family protein n=1 Tax=Oceanirhabdus sp. W0125-5 TaxID=2999116 RepID=UPI0022F2D2AA|nr:MoaD/ThiS family protein [Oceanirhabdus sp. W0125-5]WBW99511.1 MoaD/ThiS family protein [Oceanirhabdus sp. W0125-5]
MKVEVRLFATFRHGREKKQFMELHDGVTVREIINILDINEEEVAILLINGRDGTLDKGLVDGDVVSLFPPVGGG